MFYLMIKIQRTAFSLVAQRNGEFDVLFSLMCSSVSILNSIKLIKSNQMLTITHLITPDDPEVFVLFVKVVKVIALKCTEN